MILFNISKTLTKNIAWSTLARLGSQVLSILTNLILARSLGASGFGEYAFITAIVLIGNAITTFGTDMNLIRKISAEKDYSDLSAALLIQLMISIALIGLIFSVQNFLVLPSALFVYIFSLIPLSFFTIATIALRGAHEINMFSILHFMFAVLQFSSTSIFLYIDANMTQLVFLLLFAHILSAFIGILFCILKIQGFLKYLKPAPEKIIPLMKISFLLALIGSLRLIYERLTLTTLPFIASLSVTGLLSASMRVMDATKLGYIFAFTPMYPEMTRDKKFLTHHTGLNLLLLSSTFFSLIIFLWARPIINILFGSEFNDSIYSLRILVWILPPYILVSYYSLGFVALHKEKSVLFSLSVSLLSLMILLPLLYQVYGQLGVAYAIVSAEIIQAFLLWLQWRNYAFSKLSQ